MKRVFTILTTAVLLLVVGCENQTHELDLPSGGIEVPDGDIIEFGVEVGTRGDRVNEDETIDNFGVYGYQYSFSENWSGVRALAKPNVFKDAANVNYKAPAEVNLRSGYYAYEPVQQWTGNKYAFFAYYPYGSTNVVASADTELNTPYVTYTLDEENVDNLVDVMTASFINTSVNSSKYVSFNMIHRLSAIDVTAYNFYQEGAEYVDIEIQDLKIDLTNLKYNKAKIYLDDAISSVYTAGGGTASYHIIESGTDDPYTVDPNQTDVAEITADRTRSMLLIPQETTDLQVKTTIVFKKKLNGTYLEDAENPGSYEFTVEQSTTFGMPLQERSRYDVQVTFTSAAVSINIVTAAQWDDYEDNIDHDFE